MMRLTEKQQEIFEELFRRYPVLEKNREDILKAYEVLETCYRTGGKLLVSWKRRKLRGRESTLSGS
ncbi:MAG: hypothetical protein ACLUD2_03015 [Clostridium sp.]